MPLQAVVFDFDGLIADTEAPEFESWRLEFLAHGAALEMTEWSKCVGAGPGAWSVEEHFRQLAPHADLESALRSRHGRFLELSAGMKPNPGVREWIDDLIAAGIPFAIASSSRSEWVSEHLEKVGLAERFETIWTRDLVEHAKPHPDLYLAACRSLQVDPVNALALEDSSNGALAAKRAGMKAVAVPNAVTAGFDFSHADKVVPSLLRFRLQDAAALWA